MRTTILTLTMLALASCALDDTVGPTESDARSYRAVVPLSGGILQTVEISPFEPAFRDTVHIISTLSNPTRGKQQVSAQGCGVLLRSSAQLLPIGAQFCFPGSLVFELEPGESVQAEAFRVLNDTTTGLHFLGVQHSTAPDFVMLIDILLVDDG